MGGAISAPAFPFLSFDGANLSVCSNMAKEDLFLLLASEMLIASRNIIKLQESASRLCSFKRPVLRYRRECETDDNENECSLDEADSDFDEDNLNASDEEEDKKCSKVFNSKRSRTKLNLTIRPTVILPEDANSNKPHYVLYKKLKMAEYELSQLDTFPTSLECEQEHKFIELRWSLGKFREMCSHEQYQKYVYPVYDLISDREDEFYRKRQERIDSVACNYNDNIFDQTLVLPTFRGLLAQAMEQFDDWETILSKPLENDKNNRSILHFIEEDELKDTAIPPSIGCIRDAFGLLADRRNRRTEAEERREKLKKKSNELEKNEKGESLILRNCIADRDWDSINSLLLKPMHRRDCDKEEDEDYEDLEERMVFSTSLLESNIEENGKRYKSVHHVFLRNLKRTCDKHRHIYDIVKINSTMTGAKRSPLHYAAHFRRTKATVALLLMGADALQKDANGFTPGDYALRRGHKALGASLKAVESKLRCQAAVIEKIIPVEIKEYFPPIFVRKIATFLYHPLDLVGKKIVGRLNDSERPGYYIWIGFRLRKLKEKNAADPYNFKKNSNNKDSPTTQMEAKVFRACRDIDVNLLKDVVRRVGLEDSDEVAAIKNWKWNARLRTYVTGCMQPTMYRMFLTYGYGQKELHELMAGSSKSMNDIFAEGDNLLEMFVKRIVFIDGFVTSENVLQIVAFMKALVEDCEITPVHAINKIVQKEKEFEQKFPLVFKRIREIEAKYEKEQEREIQVKQEEMEKRFSHFSVLLEETLGERLPFVEKLRQLKYLRAEEEEEEDSE
jgi:hypothetical protein